jgi:hypothetical protein
VPEGIEVDMRGGAIFGGADEHGDEGVARENSPLVRISAFALFGANDVRHVRAGSGESIGELKLERLRTLLHGRASG